MTPPWLVQSRRARQQRWTRRHSPRHLQVGQVDSEAVVVHPYIVCKFRTYKASQHGVIVTTGKPRLDSLVHPAAGLSLRPRTPQQNEAKYQLSSRLLTLSTIISTQDCACCRFVNSTGVQLAHTPLLRWLTQRLVSAPRRVERQERGTVRTRCPLC